MNWLTENGNMVSVVAELARQVRGVTLYILDATDRSWLTWTPPGTSNHILWHAGHALWVQDVLIVEPIMGRGELPPDFAAKFGQNSQPASVTDWPDVSDVRTRLEAQLHRVAELLLVNAETIAAQANTPPQEGRWPLVPGMLHACHDEAKHQGEMYLLQKLHRAK
jgi:hypothetical protein